MVIAGFRLAACGESRIRGPIRHWGKSGVRGIDAVETREKIKYKVGFRVWCNNVGFRVWCGDKVWGRIDVMVLDRVSTRVWKRVRNIVRARVITRASNRVWNRIKASNGTGCD